MGCGKNDCGTEKLETDDRFCSGPWKGFFLQGFNGRQPSRYSMQLQFRFSEGQASGDGSDCHGPFVIWGRYDVDNGRCKFTKQYLGGHQVIYGGWNEEGRGIWGVWEIRVDVGNVQKGGFHLWPEGMADPTGGTLYAEADGRVESDEDATETVQSPETMVEPAMPGTSE